LGEGSSSDGVGSVHSDEGSIGWCSNLTGIDDDSGGGGRNDDSEILAELGRGDDTGLSDEIDSVALRSNGISISGDDGWDVSESDEVGSGLDEGSVEAGGTAPESGSTGGEAGDCGEGGESAGGQVKGYNRGRANDVSDGNTDSSNNGGWVPSGGHLVGNPGADVCVSHIDVGADGESGGSASTVP